MVESDRDMVPCMVVPLSRVEDVRKKLCEDNKLDMSHRIEVRGQYAYLPVSGSLEASFPVEEFSCRRIPHRPSSYKEHLCLPEDVVDLLPSSYDIVGELVVIRLPEPLLQHSSAIGGALLKFVPGSRQVFLDRGTMGDWRIRNLVPLAGEGGTKTIHRENGVDIVVDLSKAYFSPRLAGEHWQVTCMVEEGERILDMFTGTGGFPLTIAKNRKPGKVIAVDINPGAIELLEESIRLNRLDRIETHVMDAMNIDSSIGADRVIMNLPHGANIFLRHALECTRPGGMIHYHHILDVIEQEEIERNLVDKYPVRIVDKRTVRTYAPGQIHMVFDLKKDI